MRDGHAWRNWGRTQRCEPAAVENPASELEVREAITRARSAGQTVKVVGSGHSFTDIACTDGRMLTLDDLNRVLSVDEGARLVTVEAGITIQRLNEELALRGLALPNLGDIDRQSFAGAIADRNPRDRRHLRRPRHLRAGPPDDHRRRRAAALLGRRGARGLPRGARRTRRARRRHRGDAAVRAGVHAPPRRAPAPGRRGARRPRPLRRNERALRVLLAAAHGPLRDDQEQPQRRGAAIQERLQALARRDPVPQLLLRRARRRRPAPPEPRAAPEPDRRGRRRHDRAGRPQRPHPHRDPARPLRGDGVLRPARGALEAVQGVREVIDRFGLRVSFPIEVRFTAPGRHPAQHRLRPRHLLRRGPHGTRRGLRGVLPRRRGRHDRPRRSAALGKLHFQTAADVGAPLPRVGPFQAVRRKLDPDGCFSNAYLDRVLGPA